MPGKRKGGETGKTVSKKRYHFKTGTPMSPGRDERIVKAMELVKKKVPIRKAAKLCNLSYSFLQRRTSGEVGIFNWNGRNPVFNREEERSIANWLSEMAKRGMGLTPKEFLDFIQSIIKKDKRPNPFKDNRPGYEWYYGFMARNMEIVDIRNEKQLEFSRAKLTREKVDGWYTSYRDFLLSKNLLDKPAQILNADETGFVMGSKASKVIGPVSRKSAVPHVTGGSSKDRLTTMFCANAEGKIIPPFLIYPGSSSQGANPLVGSISGTVVEYSKSGWMTIDVFKKFISHFDKHAGEDRPVVLLLDSVSSHIDMDAFQLAISKGIELYRIIPNATHLMQPLDKGVFGPLKTSLNQITRAHYRENPGVKINKMNFASKLKEAFINFYKPLIVVNSFRSSGIYPVDHTVITDDHLKPGLTYANPENKESIESQEYVKSTDAEDNEVSSAKRALEVFESCLSSPMKKQYRQRMEENYDVVAVDPCYDTYRLLVMKAEATGKGAACSNDSTSTSPLDILATACSSATELEVEDTDAPSSSGDSDKVSPFIEAALKFPAAPEPKPRPMRILDTLPHNLTSSESIRVLALKELEKVKNFALKEKRAKDRYVKRKTKEANEDKQRTTIEEDDAICICCTGTFAEDGEAGIDRTWLQCDSCLEWIHLDCIQNGSENLMAETMEEEFICHLCA